MAAAQKEKDKMKDEISGVCHPLKAMAAREEKMQATLKVLKGKYEDRNNKTTSNHYWEHLLCAIQYKPFGFFLCFCCEPLTAGFKYYTCRILWTLCVPCIHLWTLFMVCLAPVFHCWSLVMKVISCLEWFNPALWGFKCMHFIPFLLSFSLDFVLCKIPVFFNLCGIPSPNGARFIIPTKRCVKFGGVGWAHPNIPGSCLCVPYFCTWRKQEKCARKCAIKKVHCGMSEDGDREEQKFWKNQQENIGKVSPDGGGVNDSCIITIGKSPFHSAPSSDLSGGDTHFGTPFEAVRIDALAAESQTSNYPLAAEATLDHKRRCKSLPAQMTMASSLPSAVVTASDGPDSDGSQQQ